MKLSKSLRYLQLASAIKNSPAQTPEQLWKNLEIKKAQFNRDKKDLEKIAFLFKYDRKQRRFIILKDLFLPVHDLTLTETFALTMAVRQLSAAGDYLLTYGAIEAVSKIIANAPGPQREMLSESLRESVLREGFGCQERVLQDLQKALHEQRRVIIQYQPPPADAPKEYEIDPYQRYFKRRALYLDAYCPETKDYRVFRLNRVSDVRFTNMGFSRHAEYNFTERHRYSAFSSATQCSESECDSAKSARHTYMKPAGIARNNLRPNQTAVSCLRLKSTTRVKSAGGCCNGAQTPKYWNRRVYGRNCVRRRKD